MHAVLQASEAVGCELLDCAQLQKRSLGTWQPLRKQNTTFSRAQALLACHQLTSAACVQVPQWWAQHAPPSTAPLATWLAALATKVTFIRQWLQNGPPAAVWLPALFAPQQFVAAVLQAHARERGVPADTLSWRVQAVAWRDVAEVPSVRDSAMLVLCWAETMERAHVGMACRSGSRVHARRCALWQVYM